MNTEEKKTVVLVEDEHDLRVLYQEILVNSGYNVEVAADGVTGLEKIKALTWHLLLLDIMLPGQDGLKVLQEISRDADLKKGPIITLTNLNSEHIIKEAFNLGADGYLIKSEITPDKILEEVKSFIG
ncbi:response regulator [candidate division WWE3 bacterium]|jgi:two-component system sensor histidine kinase and response regulator WspE|uniref:Response regulator n=1 Tax=candidate division WWE3 bacterium TaxID=2053526 RepID=A0A3A4ZHJ4_UNCKA|nr:MAG: response regulator [candidate division WWE3 bacterium]